MNLRRLEYFVAVAEELHFGKAAQRLHMAQPPLSQQIRQLEAELGITLFERSTRRVALTEAGRLLYTEAIRLLGQVGTVERRIAELRSGSGGTLRIGHVDSAGYEVVPRLVTEHRKLRPETRLDLEVMTSDEQHRSLVAGSIDVGLARVASLTDEVDTSPVLTERLCLVVPVHHHLAGQKQTSLGQLDGERFVGIGRQASPDLYHELCRQMAVAGVVYRPVLEAGGYTAILGLVAAGHGVAVVPSGVCRFRLSDLSSVELVDPSATSTLFLLRRAGDLSPLVAGAVELAGRLFGDRPQPG